MKREFTILGAKEIGEKFKVKLDKFSVEDFRKGKYTFILTTLYNVDVVDEFRQEFEITWWKVNRIWIGVGIIAVLVIFLVWLIKIKLKEKEGQEYEQEMQKMRTEPLS